MLSWVLFIPAYYVFAFIYLLLGVHSSSFIKCVLKCLPVTALMFQMLAVLVQYMKPEDSVVLSTRQFLWGITFSAIGDGCLVFKKVHVFGIISFGVSLCFYISMLGFAESMSNIGVGGVACGLGVILLSSVIALVFRSQTKRAKIPPLPVKSIYTVLIFMYFAILSLLLWSGLVLLLRQNDFAGVCSAVGAALFYISDMLIVATAIWDARILQGRALIMLTYYTAQLCFAIFVYSGLQRT